MDRCSTNNFKSSVGSMNNRNSEFKRLANLSSYLADYKSKFKIKYFIVITYWTIQSKDIKRKLSNGQYFFDGEIYGKNTRVGAMFYLQPRLNKNMITKYLYLRFATFIQFEFREIFRPISFTTCPTFVFQK